MASEAENYINSLKQKQQQETLTALLNAQLEGENAANLSQETKNELKLQKEANEFGAHTQIELFKQRCNRMYTDYKEPVETVQEVTNAHQRQLKRLTDDMILAQSVKARSGQTDSESIDFIQTYHTLLSKREPTIQIGETWHKIDLETGEVCTQPLINPFKFDITDFERHIVYGKHSKAIHVLATLEKFIEYAQNIGLTRVMFAEILRQFITNFMPEYESVISFLKDADEVFKAIVNTVNYDKLKDQVKKAIKSIKREPGESIELPLGMYRALVMEASILENPTAKEKDIIKKADKACIKTSQHLVESNLAKEIESVKILFMVNMSDRKFEYSDLIAFILKQEQKEQFRLKSTKHLGDKTVSMTVFQMDVYQPMGDFIHQFEQNLQVDVNMQQHGNTPSYSGYRSQDQMRSRRDQWDNGNKPKYNFRKPNEVNSKYRQENYSRFGGGQPQVPPHKTSYIPGVRSAPSPTRDQASSARPDTQYASTNAPGSPRGPSPNGQAAGGNYYHPVHANERTSPGFNRPRSPSPVRRELSRSPSFFRSKSGTFRPIDPKKRYPPDMKVYKRTLSGVHYSRERRTSRGNLKRGSPRRQRSCRMCGSRGHSKPASLNRVSSIPKEKRCPYINIKEQRTSCPKCSAQGKALFHPAFACVNSGASPRMSSRVNSMTREGEFNPNLN